MTYTLIGYTELSVQNKMTLITGVASLMEARIGDKIAYVLDNERNEIVLKKLSDLEVS